MSWHNVEVNKKKKNWEPIIFQSIIYLYVISSLAILIFMMYNSFSHYTSGDILKAIWWMLLASLFTNAYKKT